MAVAERICSKADFLRWNGEDPRLLSFIGSCERDGHRIMYTVGNRYSFIDVIGQSGSPITYRGAPHTLSFDGDDDVVTLLGCTDMEEGLGRLREYLGFREEVRLTGEINSLRTL